ncbi:MAG TPA: RNA polymerase sigma factor [Candidatus Dormibacteraeota bacterium]
MTGADGSDAECDFNRLYEAHRRTIHAYLLGRAGDREVARDLLQEVFLRAWRHLESGRALPAERQRAWIFTVARNLVIDVHRGNAAAAAVREYPELAVEPTAPAAEEPAARAELNERLALLERAIQHLPERLRVVLSLHVTGGLTSAQVGELLGEPAGTIRYRLSQARRQLAVELGEAR